MDKFLEIYKSTNFAIIAVTVILLVFMIAVGIAYKKRDPSKPPKGILLVAETLVNFTNNICKDTLGSRWKKFAPFILFEGMFLAVANLCGLLGLTPPTANICVPLALGIVAGFVMHIASIKYNGVKEYAKGFLEPFAIMLPLNIFSEMMTPISMGLRLFGNIFSGTVLMTLIYYVLDKIVIFSIPFGTIITPIVTPVLHAIFDVFLGLIQVYVFMLLTAIFTAGKLPDEE